MGIPARFTGGYVYWQSDFLDGQTVKNSDQNLDQWIDLSVQEKYPLGVYEYELSDSMAHAWVEIYVDGKGWIIADVTPSISMDDDTDDDNDSGVKIDFN